MGERAADRSTVTNLRVANMSGSMRKERRICGEQRADFEIAMTSECADRDVIARIVDVTKVIEAADIDEHRWRGEPQLHEREERMAAGQELGFVAMLGQRGDRGVDGVSAEVLERCGNHFEAPFDSAAQASTDFTMLW